MSKVAVISVNPSKNPGSHATVTSQAILTYNISEFKSYNVTIRCSSSTGFNAKVHTAPISDSAYYASQTGTHFSEGTCSTFTFDTVTNNNMSWLKITASATGTVSASNIQVILSCIERSM